MQSAATSEASKGNAAVKRMESFVGEVAKDAVRRQSVVQASNNAARQVRDGARWGRDATTPCAIFSRHSSHHVVSSATSCVCPGVEHQPRQQRAGVPPPLEHRAGHEAVHQQGASFPGGIL